MPNAIGHKTGGSKSERVLRLASSNLEVNILGRVVAPEPQAAPISVALSQQHAVGPAVAQVDALAVLAKPKLDGESLIGYLKRLALIETLIDSDGRLLGPAALDPQQAPIADVGQRFSITGNTGHGRSRRRDVLEGAVAAISERLHGAAGVERRRHDVDQPIAIEVVRHDATAEVEGVEFEIAGADGYNGASLSNSRETPECPVCLLIDSSALVSSSPSELAPQVYSLASTFFAHCSNVNLLTVYDFMKLRKTFRPDSLAQSIYLNAFS